MNQYVKADAKKGFKLDNNVKGLNDKGGFEVPADRVIYIDMGTRQHNGFDCSAKSDMDLFTINNGASLELVRARVYGDNRKFVIPDNANNTTLKTKYVEFNGASYYGTERKPITPASIFAGLTSTANAPAGSRTTAKTPKSANGTSSAAGKKRFAATSTGEPDRHDLIKANETPHQTK